MGIEHTRNQCGQYQKGMTKVSVPEMEIGLGQTRRALESWAQFYRGGANPDGWIIIICSRIPNLRSIVFATCVMSVTYDIDLHFVIPVILQFRHHIHNCVAVVVFVILDFVPCVWYAITNKQVNLFGVRSRRTQKIWRDWYCSAQGDASVQARLTIVDVVVAVVVFVILDPCSVCLTCHHNYTSKLI